MADITEHPAIKAIDDVIDAAETDQRDNRMSRVSDVTIQWLYKARTRVAEALQKEDA